MKIRVTKKDIENGRAHVNEICGCPINIALNRVLDVDEVRVPSRSEARLGRIKIPLPRIAEEFQEILSCNPNAVVKPFEFETELIAPKQKR